MATYKACVLVDKARHERAHGKTKWANTASEGVLGGHRLGKETDSGEEGYGVTEHGGDVLWWGQAGSEGVVVVKDGG